MSLNCCLCLSVLQWSLAAWLGTSRHLCHLLIFAWVCQPWPSQIFKHVVDAVPCLAFSCSFCCLPFCPFGLTLLPGLAFLLDLLELVAKMVNDFMTTLKFFQFCWQTNKYLGIWRLLASSTLVFAWLEELNALPINCSVIQAYMPSSILVLYWTINALTLLSQAKWYASWRCYNML